MGDRVHLTTVLPILQCVFACVAVNSCSLCLLFSSRTTRCVFCFRYPPTGQSTALERRYSKQTFSRIIAVYPYRSLASGVDLS